MDTNPHKIERDTGIIRKYNEMFYEIMLCQEIVCEIPIKAGEERDYMVGRYATEDWEHTISGVNQIVEIILHEYREKVSTMNMEGSKSIYKYVGASRVV